MGIFDILIRLILVVASIASFGPQLQALRRNADSAGISVYYVLFNLIVATHDLALLVSANIDWEGNFLVEQPPAAQDWLNVAQFLVTWLGQLVLGYHVLTLSPQRREQGKVAVAAFLSYLAITLVPALMQAFIPPEDQELFTALLVGTMLYLLGPIVQLLGLAALRVQARETRSRGSVGALSVRGLVFQAVVFLFIGLSFIYRLRIPAGELDEHWIVNVRDWYWTVGWAAINNLIFALCQGLLACIALRQGSKDPGEREALLG